MVVMIRRFESFGTLTQKDALTWIYQVTEPHCGYCIINSSKDKL